MCPSAAPLPLADRYRRESLIATGGMGQVWLAVDQVLDRQVAVKVLRSEYADDADFRARFRAEARAAAAVNDPAVVDVFDYGEQDGPDGWHAFLVMEYVEGESVQTRLARLGTLPPAEVRDLIAATASGLSAAHGQGLVHRDIKPGNLLCTTDGGIKIVDFGIARAADAVSLTRTGTIIGSAHYLSPEQAAGNTATAASDLYALGVVAYTALAGTPPYTGDTDVAVALAHLRDDVPPLPDDVPAHLRSLVMRLLAKDPAGRPASAAALAAEAGSLQLPSTGDSSIGAGAVAADGTTRVLTRVLPEPESSDRQSWHRLVLAAAAAVLIGGCGVAFAAGTSGPTLPKLPASATAKHTTTPQPSSHSTTAPRVVKTLAATAPAKGAKKAPPPPKHDKNKPGHGHGPKPKGGPGDQGGDDQGHG